MEDQNQILLPNQKDKEKDPDKEKSDPKLSLPTNKKEEVLINSIKADGGAYKGKPKNDYCLHFVETGERPQNFIRDYEEDRRFLDYPKLNDLIKLKNEVLKKRATPPMWLKCDLKTFDLSTLGKFDVILIDPPLKEYYRRAQSFGVDLAPFEPWTFDEIQNLRVDLIADNCCFLFLWVGSGEGLDKGRELLKNWNFRRCEDIVWIKTNRLNFTKISKTNLQEEDNLLQHTKEHCLVGIKGAIKRGVDSHFIHANIDTDVIVSEEPPLGSTEKPVELYRVIERFCMGRKRIELFGEDRNKRSGWLTLGNALSSNNFNLEKYNSYFKGDLCYPDVQGYEGGRYVGCSMEIENLRPRSPNRPAVNPLIFNQTVNPGANMSLATQGSNNNLSLNLGPSPMGSQIGNQVDFNNNENIGGLNNMNVNVNNMNVNVNVNVNDVNGINNNMNQRITQMNNMNNMIPMNFPYMNQISQINQINPMQFNQMQNLQNMQLNNIHNVPKVNNNNGPGNNNVNRGHY